MLGLSAVLNVNRLSHNEYANTFYSASVQSMLHSLHNFLFVSFDPGGLISVDKPPLGLWVQALSAKAFGFTPLSLLLPEAIAGVLAVAVLYRVVTPRLGPAAGVAGALALAVFPSFVAVSRDNNLDTVLILLMILACGFGLRAIETGRLRTLLGCAALVGLAFNTKTLAAYLVVPGLGLGYLVCAPGSLARRAGRLLAAGAVLLAVSASWFAIVELTPASQRPFVGSSTNNTELGLTFAYNGFGRVDGQVGGPGRIPVSFKHGSLAHIERKRCAPIARAQPRSADDAPRADREPQAQARPEPARSDRYLTEEDPAPADPAGRPGAPPDRVRRGDRAAAPDRPRAGRSGGLDAAVRAARPRRARALVDRRPLGPGWGTARSAPGGPDRAGRMVPRRGGRAEPVERNRSPLLRIGAGARGGGDGRRWRRGVRGTRPATGSAPRADPDRGRPDRCGPARRCCSTTTTCAGSGRC